MKFRKDFVTNSSSSSYICEICGRNETGYDMGMSEAEMVECVNGHVFCEDEIIYPSNKSDLIDLAIKEGCKVPRESLEADSDVCIVNNCLMELDWRYGELPECFCPICQFEEYSNSDMANYLERKYGVSRAEVFAAIKANNKRRRKLYDSEYILEVCGRYNLKPLNITESWRTEFGTYKRFMDFLCKEGEYSEDQK